MAFSLDTWIEQLNRQEVVFAFKGELSEDMLTDLLLIVENKLEETNTDRKITKKIYNVTIESLQNLFHHSDNVFLNGIHKRTMRYALLYVTKENGNYKIRTGNFLNQEKVVFLSKHIEKINSLNKDDLKLLYKDVLNNQSFSKKGGGGLGLIDIARNAEYKIEYNFYSYKNSLSFFDFCIEIKQ